MQVGSHGAPERAVQLFGLRLCAELVRSHLFICARVIPYAIACRNGVCQWCVCGISFLFLLSGLHSLKDHLRMRVRVLMQDASRARESNFSWFVTLHERVATSLLCDMCWILLSEFPPSAAHLRYFYRCTNDPKGHNLCWGNYNPDWLLPLSSDELRAALKNHIETVTTHYGEAAYGWYGSICCLFALQLVSLPLCHLRS